jgi:predicted RNA-binding Zn-ribbon protein involved in translation (DUF1610 family)
MAIVRLDGQNPPEPQQPQEQLFQCANCGRTIGALEQPYIWGEHVVCPQCLDLLQQPVPVAPPAPPRQQVFRGADGPSVICPNPNCGYVGRSNRKPKGNRFLLIFLLLFWLIPGIIYAVLYQGHVLSCPKCGVKIRDE